MQLKRFEQDGLELVIDLKTGEAFASIRATARMIDKSPSLVHNYVNGKFAGVQKFELLNSKIHTTGGIKDVRLLNESQILELVSKYKSNLLIQFAQIGLRAFLHNLAGYKVQSTALTEFQGRKLPQNFRDAVLMLADEVEKNEALESQILEDEPYTSLGKQIETTINGFTIGQYAKHLGRSRNKTFKELRELGFIQKFPSTLPYQHHIDRGYFKIITTIKTDRWANQRKFAVAIVTSKGEIAIERARLKSIKKDNAIALIESAIDHELIVI
jgi:phage antirepressor YoqD-like protein